MFNLISNEKIIIQLPGLYLSNYRVVRTIEEQYNVSKQTILLQNICSCEMMYKRNSKHYQLAILFFVLNLPIYFYVPGPIGNIVMSLLIITALIYLGMYFLYVSKAIIISSSNSKIVLESDGSKNELLEFIEEVDKTIIQSLIK